ncbi:O-succinylhomoserine sulfhydrylase [Neisseriaceae bacterium PsAf]|nr:O-succinylhomoserine sulfhydrylase [Neisseriaceae bacterium PsAf]
MVKKLHPETLAIRGFKEQTSYNEHNQALFLTSSFTYPDSATAESLFLGEKEGYTYSRTANPTVTTFAKRVALLEGAEAAQATATGMAAIQATFLSFLKAGDHLVVSRSIFGTTVGLVNSLTNFGIEVTYVPLIDLNAWQEAIQPNTKMFFFETPSNPLGEVVDIAALSKIAHEKDILVAVDNSFCSPILQQPIQLDADLSIQSATKLIDGQGRVFGGVVSGSQVLINDVFAHVKTAGQVLSPFNAWVLISGLETIFVRVERQCQSALALAEWLEKHPKVEKVFYPGLKSHPQYDLIQKQQKAGGIVLSFRAKGGKEEAWKLVNNVKLFSTTGNLGDVRSIITHPFTTTHCKVDPKVKIESGITENLIRVSVGLEHIDDLKQDLEETLNLI